MNDMPIAKTVRTTCPYCGVGCGVLAQVGADGRVTVSGDPAHRANFGRLCSKGSALAETLDLEGRLLYPEIEGERVGWDAALDHVAGKFRQIADQHGRNAVAFYVSGQLLTEDYYVANKLMKGFIGSSNIDTNSRLCMASAVAGYKRAFGSDSVPCSYDDLEQADLIVLVGSNAAWCHPVLFQRMRAAREQRKTKFIVIDPRRTESCEFADLHLPLQSGSDAMLFNGLLNFLRREDALDFAFLEANTEGFAAALQAARDTAPTIPAVAQACGLKAEDVAEFFRLFARTQKVITFYSQGVNQSSSGVDKSNAIINCHLATGKIGKPGMGPFSITGQPNAMGGREVGGLANQLAAHMDFDPQSLARVGRFWNAARMTEGPGLKAVDMFNAIESGSIKAVWVMATNPVVSLPDANRVRAALEKCEFVVVSDCMRDTDTTRTADVLLPAAGWGEKDGTVTNSERRISRQRAFLNLPGEARPDWSIIAEVGRRMGYAKEFAFENAAQVFREHARLSALDNGGTRDFDLGALVPLTDSEYDTLTPVQWPVPAGNARGTERMFGDGKFFTPSRRARLLPVTPRAPVNPVDIEYPLALNTGRIRDQWHTMTRTGKSPRLSSHEVEPYVQIHPADAAQVGIKDGALAQLESRWGSVIVRAAESAEQRPGSVFVPMHWNDIYTSKGAVDKLVNPATDPISGQPELKHTPVRVRPYAAGWYGFLLTRRLLELNAIEYWTRAKGVGYMRYEMAGQQIPQDWASWARQLLCHHDGKAEWIEFFDRKAGRYRAGRIVNDRLESCLFVSRDPVLPSRAWLGQLFEQETLSGASRNSLLAGKPMTGEVDQGETVCACFSVGKNSIQSAIAGGCRSVEQIGSRLKAGTNCGSCIPELKKLLQQAS